MRTSNKPPAKTLGTQAARLVTSLHERGRRIFTLSEVAAITGLGETSTRSFARKLVNRGVAGRLSAGLFTLIPFELGREREHLGNPYVVARELMRGKPYYVSHASAMDVHRMLTQPQFVVHVTSPRPMRARTILGTEFRFVRCKPEHLFGTTEHWMDKHEQVRISDIERTVLDGLRQPEYCGGFSEVARGFWMRQADVDVDKLVNYALRLDVGAVFRRLGYLLEIYEIEARKAIKRLRARLTATYVLLDPLLPPEGKFLARWKVRQNVSPEEIRAGVRV
jgi:predicted transcriptional regulator of viral defense system